MKTLDGIRLSDFVTILLGNTEWQHCPVYIAEKLQEADKEGQFVFVELPNELNGLSLPKVWNVRDWKQSYERLLKRRQLSEHENRLHIAISECRNKALAHLVALTGLDSDRLLDAAQRIIRSRNTQAMLNVGVKEWQIKELEEAERELNQYRTKIGMK